MIVRALALNDDGAVVASIKEEAEALAQRFPVPGIDS